MRAHQQESLIVDQIYFVDCMIQATETTLQSEIILNLSEYQNINYFCDHTDKGQIRCFVVPEMNDRKHNQISFGPSQTDDMHLIL